MAERCEYQHQVKTIASSCFLLVLPAILGAAAIAWLDEAEAQEKECGTVKECAVQMVELANQLKADNIALTKRVEELEVALKNQVEETHAALEKRITLLKSGEISNPVGGACPPNSFVVEIVQRSVAGGGSGYLQSISFLCRYLN
jgi:hypothetical protein